MKSYSKQMKREEDERHEYIVEYETNYDVKAEALDVQIARRHARITVKS